MFLTMAYAVGSSPHTRGAPAHGFTVRERRRIIPAYAGSTEECLQGDRPDEDHPRIRGEHRRLGRLVDRGVGSSPHTRGARRCSRRARSACRIIPAYAGSTPPWSWRARSERDHPRIRGEHFRPVEPVAPGPGSSPHTRGAPSSRMNSSKMRGIIPAYAGSTRSPRRARGWLPDHPRIRGEHGYFEVVVDPVQGSSPHTRGAQRLGGFLPRSARIIPAYAGSTSPTPPRSPTRTDHPRIRGEHLACDTELLLGEGSSPHTRGALRHSPRTDRRQRIIPAYAGSTSVDCPPTVAPADHPRIRGEHELKAYINRMRAGSSPHTRGAPSADVERVVRERIIPAYAGSTSPPGLPPEPSPDHPRIRGEHFQTFMADIAERGSSPHTRGARRHGHSAGRRQWIIPAYAGSTRGLTRDRRHRADHPRIRGEHVTAEWRPRTESGSSPHTRGARRSENRVGGHQRIIPAYAGSTQDGFTYMPEAGDHPRIRGEHHRLGCAGDFGQGSSPHTRGAHLEIPAIPRIAVVIIPVFLYPSPTPQEEADRSMVLLTLS